VAVYRSVEAFLAFGNAPSGLHGSGFFPPKRSFSRLQDMTLKPCPKCGKKEGKLLDRRPSRLPYALQCGACGWLTDFVKLAAVAEKLWNEAKKPD
jgi:hypothetical protein